MVAACLLLGVHGLVGFATVANFLVDSAAGAREDFLVFALANPARFLATLTIFLVVGATAVDSVLAGESRPRMRPRKKRPMIVSPFVTTLEGAPTGERRTGVKLERGGAREGAAGRAEDVMLANRRRTRTRAA